jgi:fimbrial chaperone protein
MEVAPVVIDLGRASPSAVLTIRNKGTSQARYQLSAASWSEPKVGAPRLEPSQELSFFPPVFQIAPGDERKIRIGATVPAGTTERAWRLFVEELPEAVESPRAGASVRIRTRFALPVFLAPALPRPSSTLALSRSGDGVAVVLRNTGNVRVKPLALSVAFLGANGERLREEEVPPVAVLADAEWTTEVKLPADVCAKVRKAVLAAEIEGEKRGADIGLPDGACGP